MNMYADKRWFCMVHNKKKYTRADVNAGVAERCVAVF